jgi:hypothetical protein
MGDDAVIIVGVDSTEAKASLYSTTTVLAGCSDARRQSAGSRVRRWTAGCRTVGSP